MRASAWVTSLITWGEFPMLRPSQGLNLPPSDHDLRSL
jgi:hypothetical protein